MLKVIISFLSLMMLLVCPAVAQTRHALVVGIDTYENVGSLVKARNDARAVAAALEEAGFRTQLVIDADETALLTELTRFSGQLDPGDEEVFYFAGHGVEINGRNYLPPANVPSVAPGQELVVTRGALPVGEVIDQFNARGVRLSLLILDACRDDPFERLGTRSLGRCVGLGREDAPEGTFVMFSAGAGQQALDRLSEDDPDPNSVFTRVLLSRLNQPGLSLRTMVREVRSEVRALGRTVAHEQFPAVYDQLDGAFNFVAALATPDIVGGVPTASDTSQPGTFASTDLCAAARADWSLIGETPSRALLEVYSTAHSGCPLMMALASERLASLIGGPATPMVTPISTPQSNDTEAAQLVQACVAAAHPDAIGWNELQSPDALDSAQRACNAALQAFPDASSEDYAQVTALLGRVAHRRGDFDAAHDLYRTAAEVGDGLALNNLGRLYQYGEGVTASYDEAALFYREGVEAGFPISMVNLGLLYLDGRGVPQDYAEAARLFRDAANQGVAAAKRELATLHLLGNGVAQDYAEAARLYIDASNQGISIATSELAILYLEGNGVAQSSNCALELFLEAAEPGVASAMGDLGFLYGGEEGIRKDLELSVAWYRRGIEAGEPYAMISLGFVYLDGRGVPQDNREAAQLSVQALAAGGDYPIRYSGEFYGAVGREIQILLRDQGIYDGVIDGVYDGAIEGAVGSGTVAAMQAYMDSVDRGEE